MAVNRFGRTRFRSHPCALRRHIAEWSGPSAYTQSARRELVLILGQYPVDLSKATALLLHNPELLKQLEYLAPDQQYRSAPELIVSVGIERLLELLGSSCPDQLPEPACMERALP